KELWDTLVVLFEGTKQVKKNKKSHLIQEYENFKAKTEDSLTQTYDRFNCLINDLRQHGIEKENEENLIKFLSCLPEEWETLSLV
ncbi:hypothetical protein HA378_32405, partial [Escherichia coli]|nr:hypothetical protein [Escherichia coli]